MMELMMELEYKYSSPLELYKYPGRLTWLAMDSFGLYVSNLYLMLVAKKDNNLVKKVCQHLQDMLWTKVPKILCRELKIRLLKKFEGTFKMFRYQRNPGGYYQIAVRLMMAILDKNTNTTEMICDRFECRGSCHPDLLTIYKMEYNALIYDVLPELRNLKELHVHNNPFCATMTSIERGNITKHLETFRGQMSSNEQMRVLSERCKGLKILDIGVSDGITNESIPYILNFECLEELEIQRSRIDIMKLVTSLAQRRHSCGKNASELIKRFSWFDVDHSDINIEIFINHFPNLISLTLYGVKSDLTPLKTLQHLRQLQVEADYVLLQGLIASIGNKLTCLHLRNVKSLDLSHLSQYCTSVYCLHIEIVSPKIDLFSDGLQETDTLANYCKNYSPMPEFPSVSYLQLSSNRENANFMFTLLEGFKYVRKLFIGIKDYFSILGRIIERRSMKNLQEVYFGKRGRQSVDATIEFFEDYAVITNLIQTMEGSIIFVRSKPLNK